MKSNEIVKIRDARVYDESKIKLRVTNGDIAKEYINIIIELINKNIINNRWFKVLIKCRILISKQIK